MPDRTEIFALGLQYHQAGQLAQAEQMYRQVLEIDPDNTDALCSLGGLCLALGQLSESVAFLERAVQLRPESVELRNDLGVILAQQGKLDEATACFRQAVESHPDYAEAYNNLGIALSQQGKLIEAVRSYHHALRIKADYAEAHSNMGLALGSLGKLAEAIAAHRQALEIKPDFVNAANNLSAALGAQQRLTQNLADFRMGQWYLSDDPAAYNELGLALKTQGRLTEAIASFEEALQAHPDFAEAHNNLAVAFKERGNWDEAVASLRQALALNPDFVEAYNNLGTMLESVGNLDEASACYQQALNRKPDFAEAHNNLAIILNKQGKYTEAWTHYQRALTLKPDYPDAHHNLGTLLVDQGNLSEGVASYERALQLKPDYVEAHLGRAQAWLQMGDWERGWPEFEWRWWRKSFPPRPFQQPMWDGSPLDGRTILLHAEQGLGDTLQFIRYAPLVKQRGGFVIVECQPSLLPLLATCAGIDQLVASGSALPYFDVHAPLVSLPGILRTTLETVPAEVPYLFADPERVEHWRQAFAPIPSQAALSSSSGEEGNVKGTFTIGIAWQGNPGHTNDRQRSVLLASFEPLARFDGVRLFSLQKGPGTEQLAAAKERLSLPDLGSQFHTFQDTAAALVNLDLVITVDSAVAHCAGAVGVPVWVLIPYAADWRWLLDREDSPWYPTMRLFRQKEPGNWDGVFDSLVVELAELLAKEAVLSSTRRGRVP